MNNTSRFIRLIHKEVALLIFAVLFSIATCWVLQTWGLKVVVISVAVFMFFAFVGLCTWLDFKEKLGKSEIIVFILMYVGFLMIAASYYLAYIGSDETGISLAKVGVTEMIAPPAILLIKAVVENLSKNNSWPDKPATCKDTKPSGTETDTQI